MGRAVAVGIGVPAVGYALHHLVGHGGTWADVLVPLPAGFAASWLTPRQKIRVGAAMAVPPSVIFFAVQTVCELSDFRCDRFGAAGTIALGLFMLAWNLVFCGSGAVAAEFAQRRLRSPSARS